jgi:tetratricopeptide (TPR) repeat protein
MGRSSPSITQAPDMVGTTLDFQFWFRDPQQAVGRLGRPNPVPPRERKVHEERLRGPNADAHLGLGLELAAEQNHMAAIQEFNTAIKLDPELSGIYYEIGHSYAMVNKVDDAIAAFTKERQLNGDDQYIESGLAAAYKSKGMAAEAKDAQSKAERLSKIKAND